MSKKIKRTYSLGSQHAARLLGQLIQGARKEKKMTLSELAERAGISRGTLTKVLRGHLACELGIVFEVASIVGVKLFDMDEHEMASEVLRQEKQLTLLPSRIRNNKDELDDDF